MASPRQGIVFRNSNRALDERDLRPTPYTLVVYRGEYTLEYTLNGEDLLYPVASTGDFIYSGERQHAWG